MSSYSWTYTTWPDAGAAREAAAVLIDERLCACANILPAMTSVYRWEGRVETASEAVMILKTSPERKAALRDRIAQLHPYDEPCILSLSIDDEGNVFM